MHEAILHESHFQLETDLYQDFNIPAGVTSLAFTIDGSTTDGMLPSGVAPDAFGVSLFDVCTQAPLVGSVDSATDSYYIQDLVPGVQLGKGATGVTIVPGSLPGSWRVSIDVSQLAGQDARLLFRLLSGSDGSQLDSSVPISQVDIVPVTVSLVGINLSPAIGADPIGTTHTVIATLEDQLAGAAAERPCDIQRDRWTQRRCRRCDQSGQR